MRPYTRSENHVGEWKLAISADTPEEIFTEAARAVSRQSGSVTGESIEWKTVHVEARDLATLLVDWLNELLGRSEIERVAFSEIRKVQLRDEGIEAEIRGKPVTQWRSPLKAATYHGLEFGRQNNRWKATVLFDV